MDFALLQVKLFRGIHECWVSEDDKRVLREPLKIAANAHCRHSGASRNLDVEVFSFMFAHGYLAYSVEADMRRVSLTDVERWFETRRRDFGYVSYFFEKSI